MTRWKKRLLIPGVAVVVVVWLVGFSGLWTRFFREPVVYGALVGKTENEVRWKYGAPTDEWEGYHQLGNGPPSPPPNVPMKTLIFEPRGPFHLEGGTYWVWFKLRDGVWVCSGSCWFADGVNF
jgi:hypothetical protein